MASNLGRWVIAFVPLLLTSLLAWWYWPQPQGALYSLYRSHNKAETLAGLQEYRSVESPHFQLFYKQADTNTVQMIIDAAESVYQPVIDKIGYQPTSRIPIIVYSNRNDLRNAFGWSNGESALGVYWSGTIRLLSPNAWIQVSDQSAERKAFAKLNPLAHELTHYLLDYRTNGNYPRWFTEGLAQRVEYSITGYLWIEPDSTLRQPLYTLSDLENRFDQLPNQALGYRESYLLVDYMAKTYGEGALSSLVRNLSDGVPFSEATEQAFGVSMPQIQSGWMNWIQNNLSRLDPVE